MSNLDDRWQFVAIEKLVSADWNYKTDDAALEEKLSNNIKRNGQIENIIVRELDTGFFEVVNGNHRLKVMKGLGQTKLMTYNLGKVSDSAAALIAVETNETRFNSDNMKLAEVMKRISEEYSSEQIAKTTKFSEDEVKNFNKLLEFDFNAFETDPAKANTTGSGHGLGGDEWKTISLKLPEGVAEQFEEQVLRFKKALHPDEEDYDAVSPVQAIEALTQHLAQIEDGSLI